MLTIRRFPIGSGGSQQLVGVNPVIVESDFFRNRDLDSLNFLDGFDKVAGLGKRTDCPGIQPGKAAAKNDAVNFAFFQIDFIQIGNFVFAAG